MKRSLVLVVSAAALAAVAPEALAADRRVPQDFETIQEAVNAAADNDRIVISSGRYIENVTVTKNGLTFIGKKVILDGTLIDGSEGTTLNITGDRITIDGLAFVNGGTQIAITGDRATIRKCTFRNGSGNGVYVSGADAVVDRCVVTAPESDGISISGANAKVTACRVTNSGDGGIYVSGNGARVERCTTSNMVDDAGIEIDGNTAFVSRNRVSGCDDYGIDVTGNDGRIEGNVVTATESSGIYVSGDNPRIIGNSVSSIAGEDSGITVSGSNPGGLIERNVVSDTTEEGIEVSNPGITVRRNVVQRVGGEDDAGYYFTGAGIIAEDNRAIDCDDYGFEVAADNVVLRRCTATNSARTGIFVGSNANVTVDGCTSTGGGIAGIENYGSSTILRGSKFSGHRRDVTNNGTYSTFQGNTFRTGGESTPVFDLGQLQF